MRYELMKMVAQMPGSLAQVGVGNGFGLLTMARLGDILAPYSTDQHYFGFDAFDFYPEPDEDEIRSVTELKASKHNRFSESSQKLVQDKISQYELQTPFPSRKSPRTQLIAGLAEESLPAFDPQGIRFKLVEIDVNLRQGTKTAIEILYPLLIPGGIMTFGGYAAGPWEGESEVVHEFLGETSLQPQRIHGLTYPSCFVAKPHILNL